MWQIRKHNKLSSIFKRAGLLGRVQLACLNPRQTTGCYFSGLSLMQHEAGDKKETEGGIVVTVWLMEMANWSGRLVFKYPEFNILLNTFMMSYLISAAVLSWSCNVRIKVCATDLKCTWIAGDIYPRKCAGCNESNDVWRLFMLYIRASQRFPATFPIDKWLQTFVQTSVIFS